MYLKETDLGEEDVPTEDEVDVLLLKVLAGAGVVVRQEGLKEVR